MFFFISYLFILHYDHLERANEDKKIKINK